MSEIKNKKLLKQNSIYHINLKIVYLGTRIMCSVNFQSTVYLEQSPKLMINTQLNDLDK